MGLVPNHRLRIAASALLVAWIGLPVWAQPAPAGKTNWSELSQAQRGALAPLQQQWPGIDPAQRAKWLEIAGRFPRMPAEEQARVQGRMAEWARLTPTERGRARATFQETKQLPAQDRQARWEAYKALPAEEQKALAQRNALTSDKPRPKSTGDAAKLNIVGNPSLQAPPARPVAPTVVQARPGATTTLVTRQAQPPAHQQPGMPKITATQGFVDRDTLLPKRGAQGAAMRVGSAASAPSTKP